MSRGTSTTRQRTRTHVRMAKVVAKANGCTCRAPFPKVVMVDAEAGFVDMRHEESCRVSHGMPTQ